MVTKCRNCGYPVMKNKYGGWVHDILGVTYCASQFPETVYNNWDKRVAYPEESSATE